MKISIVTACYNSVLFIRSAIESVLAQTHPDVEYLVVDGGSTDGTVDVLRDYAPKFGGRMHWVSERDAGMYDAINKGIRMATGDVVGILNADDVLSTEDVVRRVVAAFEATPVGSSPEGSAPQRSGFSAPNADEQVRKKPDAVYGDVRFVANRANTALANVRAERTVRYYSARYWEPWMLRWGFMPPHPSVYIRRALFERLGNYKTGYHIAADYELLIRYLWKAELTPAYVPICLVTMRMGGRSTRGWRSNLTLNREIVRGNRENGVYTNLAMLLPKYLFKVWEFVGNGRRMTM